MTNDRPRLIATLLCLYWTPTAHAQQPQPTAVTVPKLVRFSGSFRPASGTPAQTMESVTLSVYRDQTGGDALWHEIQNVSVDTDGHYSVLMGATHNDGMPLDLFASGEPRWLGAQFNRPGEAEQPRVLLVSVPYALKAADADTLGGKPASSFLLAAPSVGTDTARESAVPGTTTSATTAVKPKATPASSGQPNYIGKFTNTTDLIDSAMYEVNGNVGIFTTQPAISLDVRTGTLPQMGIAGTTDYLTFFASDQYGPAIYWDPAKDMRFGKGGSGLYNPFGFVEQMRIKSSNGNVGIGTQSPGSKLDIAGDINLTGIARFQGNPFLQIPGGVAKGNTSLGLGALPGGTTGSQNTATGASALSTNTTGYFNTAHGASALATNTTGNSNTAHGAFALSASTIGVNNTASGAFALGKTTIGNNNTASGFAALQDNSTGDDNTASGNLALLSNTTGNENTAVGSGALQHNTTGTQNTAGGATALALNTVGSNNTADGYGALYNNTTGTQNTAGGATALASNTIGSYNTADGYGALYNNTTGTQNTAGGATALASNTIGSYNTAHGYAALLSNTTGIYNTASGYQALENNTAGGYNTSVGIASLKQNTTGASNTATGDLALGSNTTGSNNTANGGGALYRNTTGSLNIAIGAAAAGNVSGGNSNNIHIGNSGEDADNGTIRIGDSNNQSKFYVAGVRGVTTVNNNAIPVVIDSAGQLGTVSSSRRFKEDIEDMGAASHDLMRLRPVTFRYKQPFADGSKPIQYGLIAEEVAEVYPDLVAHSADGQIETVKYQVLDSMLLNEVQRQQVEFGAQRDQLQRLMHQFDEQRQQNQSLRERLARLEAILASMSGVASASGIQ